MEDKRTDEKKIALFIDAENISYKNAEKILEILDKKGKIIIKTVVADWTKIVVGKGNSNTRNYQSNGWRVEANKHSLTPTHAFTYVSGKNTSDLMLTICAMKTLYEKPFISTFCLVSNDSDFTRLVQELRESDKEVIGMGERGKAIQKFVNAFSEFIYLDETIADVEELEKASEAVRTTGSKEEAAGPKKKKSPAKKKETTVSVIPKEQLKALEELIENIMEDKGGLAEYSLLNLRMKQLFSDFVPENYGCKNVSALFRKILPELPQYVEHRESIPGGSKANLLMLKKKE